MVMDQNPGSLVNIKMTGKWIVFYLQNICIYRILEVVLIQQ